MIYEIRIYHMVPGRLDVARGRFKHHLPTLFERHRVKHVGQWTAIAGAKGPLFVYILAFADLNEREARWGAFYQDPEWHRVRAETQGDEEAVERFDVHFIRPNAAAPDPSEAAAETSEFCELSFCEVAPGQLGAATDYLREHYFPAVVQSGGRVRIAADFVAGPDLPRIAILTGWPDANRWQEGRKQLETDPELYNELRLQRRARGRALIGFVDSFLLAPAPFGNL